MKLFKRELYEAASVFDLDADNLDSAWRDEASKKWHAAFDIYEKQLNEIKPLLPKSMQKFEVTAFHDGTFKSYSQKNDQIILKICGGYPGPLCGNYELIFTGVSYYQGLKKAVRDTWLYEEIHLSHQGKFEFHALLDESEFVIVADRIELLEHTDP